MTAFKYPADAWGGTQIDDYIGGAPPRSALHPSTAHPIQASWDDTEIPDEQFCASMSSKTRAQCRAYKVKGEQHCHFHLKKVREEREQASHGDEPGADS